MLAPITPVPIHPTRVTPGCTITVMMAGMRRRAEAVVEQGPQPPRRQRRAHSAPYRALRCKLDRLGPCDTSRGGTEIRRSREEPSRGRAYGPRMATGTKPHRRAKRDADAIRAAGRADAARCVKSAEAER